MFVSTTTTATAMVNNLQRLVYRYPTMLPDLRLCYSVMVPFDVMNVQKLPDGNLVTQWDRERPTPTDAEEHLLATYAVPPAAHVILMSDRPESGVLACRCVTRKDPYWEKANKEMTRDGIFALPSDVHTLVWSYGVAHIDGLGLLAIPTRHIFGDRVRPDFFVRDPNTLSDEQIKLSADIQLGRLHRWYERVGVSMPHQLTAGIQHDPKYFLDVMLTAARDHASVITSAFALMACSNVVRETVSPKQDRAARRRGDPPPLQYHVLKVRPQRARREQSGAGADEPVAIHFVRGHIKQYSEDRPLFGKHSGLWYWQPHLAGRAPRVVDKDYEIEMGS